MAPDPLQHTWCLLCTVLFFLLLYLYTPRYILVFLSQVMAHLKTSFSQQTSGSSIPGASQSRPAPKVRRTVVTRIHEAIKAIALCHNVTPVYEEADELEESLETEADQQDLQEVSYQASSPDEVSRTWGYITTKPFFLNLNHVFCILHLS